jgi:hypothetical protein
MASLMLIFACGTSVASAWTNGPSTIGKAYVGKGNGYGTHDWVISQALRIARRTDPKAGAWLDLKTALRASDDPDTYHYNIDWHLFRDTGTSRGAPAEIAELYYQISLDLKAGHRYAAAQKFGWLSHYYADEVQPFHLTWDATYHNGLHYTYEHTVDPYLHHPTDMQAWAVAVPAKPLTDVRQRAVNTAVWARGYYKPLLASFSKNQRVSKKGNRTAYSITGKLLSRASNDLADLILAMPKGQGFSPVPTRMTAWVSQQHPYPDQKICADVKCVDANGAPMEGVAVEFSWEQPNGSFKKSTLWTFPNGIAQPPWTKIGNMPLMRYAKINTVARSIGTSISASTWFQTTPVLADGADGMVAWADPEKPSLGTTVALFASCHDTSGKAVGPGLDVRFDIEYPAAVTGAPGSTVILYAVTDGNGMAEVDVSTGLTPDTVFFTAWTTSGGHTRHFTKYFTPQ